MRVHSTSSPPPSSTRTPTRSHSIARPTEYRCAPLVELRLIDDWALTIARRYLYEEADRVRIEALKESDDAELAGLAAKIDREEVYHRLHAELWEARLRDEPRFTAAVEQLWPYALGVLDPAATRGARPPRRSTECGPGGRHRTRRAHGRARRRSGRR